MPLFSYMNINKSLLYLSLIITPTWLVYYPGISGPFLFDDRTNILNNAFIRITSLSINELISSAFSGNAGPLKRPIAMLSFALNYFFSGSYDASSFKVTNIIIHILNACLTFILAKKLISLAAAKLATPAKQNTFGYLAFGIALIWALHPINLTSVLYIVQRMTSLATLFSLLAIITYLNARKSSEKNRCTYTTFLYFTSLCFFSLAIFSKENALLVPLIILAIELTLLTDHPPWSRINRLSKEQKATLLSAIILVGGILLTLAIAYSANGYNSRPFTLVERVLTETRVLSLYISLALIPRIDGFGLFHDEIALSTGLLTPITTFTSITFILLILLSALLLRKRNPLYSLGVFWFFIGHMMESTVFPLEIAHEHRNNLPSIGIFLAVFSFLLSNKTQRNRYFITLTICAFIVGATTFLRSSQWSNYQSLAFYEASHNPNSPATQALLSNAAYQAKNYPASANAIKKAMELDPQETAYALHYQVILAISKKEIPEELQQLTLQKIRQNKFSPSTQLALDHITGCINKYRSCKPLRANVLAWIELYIEKQPTSAYLFYLKGKALKSLDNSIAAKQAFNKASLLKPPFIHPLFDLVDMYFSQRNLREASLIIERIVQLNNNYDLNRSKEIKELQSTLTILEQRQHTL